MTGMSRAEWPVNGPLDAYRHDTHRSVATGDSIAPGRRGAPRGCHGPLCWSGLAGTIA
jgi:hypothetical protein